MSRALFALVAAPVPAYEPQVGWTYEVQHENAHRVILRARRDADGRWLNVDEIFTISVPIAQFRDYWGRALPRATTNEERRDERIAELEAEVERLVTVACSYRAERDEARAEVERLRSAPVPEEGDDG